jgi:hypothetical protein
VSDALGQRIRAQLTGTCDFPDDQRDRLLSQIRQRHGDHLQAILIYGSYLRGKRDTLLDFYVLLDSYAGVSSRWQGWLAKALPPNVYQIQDGVPPNEVRAKYALLTLERFEYCMEHDFHSYFWARFAQPCGVLYCRDEQTMERLVAAIGQATMTFVRKVLPTLPDRFDTARLWSAGLELTYRCEFRSEPPGHAEKLYGYWPDYYREVTSVLAEGSALFGPLGADDEYINRCTTSSRRGAGFRWRVRMLHGKALSTLRLLKAALTFDGALDYLLWKISRHSGVYIEPTERQRKFPLIFAWPLLFRLYRRGAFR